MGAYLSQPVTEKVCQLSVLLLRKAALAKQPLKCKFYFNKRPPHIKTFAKLYQQDNYG